MLIFVATQTSCTRLASNLTANKSVINTKIDSNKDSKAASEDTTRFSEYAKTKASTNEIDPQIRSGIDYKVEFNRSKQTLNDTPHSSNSIVEIPELFADSTIPQDSQSTPDASTQKKRTTIDEATENDSFKESILFIRLIKTDLINRLNSNATQVLYKSTLTDKTVALNDLQVADEDSFCGVQDFKNLIVNSVYGITSIDQTQIDKNFDVYETTFTLIDTQKNKSKIVCTHTTNNFYIEQLIKNFKQELQVFSRDKVYDDDVENFQHLRTLNRKINAIKIKNLGIFQEFSAAGGAKALINGKLVPTEDAGQALIANQTTMFCQMGDRSKNLDFSKNYIRVAKKMGSDNYEMVIFMTTTYMADENNYFVLGCWMNKNKAVWYDLLKIADGIFEFGTLGRIEYNKKYDEVKALYEKTIPN